MKIAIIGAGAIGGLVGARLAFAGNDVTFLVRGANLEVIRERGVTLIEADGVRRVARNVAATDDYDDAGTHEMVILAMKSHQVQAVTDRLPRLLGPTGFVVTMQNGIPFWYFQGHGGPRAGSHLTSVDPDGRVAASIPSHRVIGCVVYPASELIEPGVIRHVEGDRFPLGELDGSRSARVQRAAACFEDAGFKAPVLEDIRSEVWLKLWGNLAFNPISALSRATLVDICRYPPTRALAESMMREAQEVAEKLGVSFRVTLARRIAGAEKVGRHRTSMLMDVEAGRPTEVDALLGPVIELGRLTATPTPHLDAVYALVRLLTTDAGDAGTEAAAPPASATKPIQLLVA